MEYFINHFQVFLLILSRLMGLLSVAPVFSYPSISVPQKMIFSFLVSVILFPVIAGFLPPVPGDMGSYGLTVIAEALIGILLGFLISLIFAAFQMAGEFLTFNWVLVMRKF